MNSSYTTTLVPLTAEDKQVIKKAISTYYKPNIILLPLLVVCFFFGIWYLLFWLALVIWYNISAFSSIKKNERSLDQPKMILTGKITKKEPPGEEMVIFLGGERFDITYANVTFPLEVDDLVAIHYSQFDDKKRGELLSVEKKE
ncbi:hypothetical protein [Pedobacter caeni]|uniref:Uncharacterized protein n=1 Tax=Pedobacter caeni TaxID=288992 RepID=A0A1M4W648_9SPHI|nr:hypothetical protein [Pedobacter caeni]SHE76677.1 hypothetical protein SAMN04488522_1011148 [Pedobacter caeni]